MQLQKNLKKKKEKKQVFPTYVEKKYDVVWNIKELTKKFNEKDDKFKNNVIDYMVKSHIYKILNTK